MGRDWKGRNRGITWGGLGHKGIESATLVETE